MLGNLFYLSSNFLILISVISNLMLNLSNELLISIIIFFNFLKFYLILFKIPWSLSYYLWSLIHTFDANFYYSKKVKHAYFTFCTWLIHYLLSLGVGFYCFFPHWNCHFNSTSMFLELYLWELFKVWI